MMIKLVWNSFWHANLQFKTEIDCFSEDSVEQQTGTSYSDEATPFKEMSVKYSIFSKEFSNLSNLADYVNIDSCSKNLQC